MITGASSGIGEATARRLAREPGARLVLVARRKERLDVLADQLGGATVVAVDLTDRDAPKASSRRLDGRTVNFTCSSTMRARAGPAHLHRPGGTTSSAT